MEATEEFERVREDLQVKIAKAQAQYQRTQTQAADIIRQVEQQSSFDPELQTMIAEQVRTPFTAAFEKMAKATLLLEQSTALLDIKVRQGLGG